MSAHLLLGLCLIENLLAKRYTHTLTRGEGGSEVYNFVFMLKHNINDTKEKKGTKMIDEEKQTRRQSEGEKGRSEDVRTEIKKHKKEKERRWCRREANQCSLLFTSATKEVTYVITVSWYVYIVRVYLHVILSWACVYVVL